MAEPTLADIFGAGVTQTATTITLVKADLTGLTPSANNTGESIFAGIVNKAKDYLTQTNFDANTDQSIVIGEPFDSLTTRGVNNDTYRQTSFTVSFSKLDAGSAFDPDDY